jgi:phage shock protein PspC (stress-responsive transcriptional regulator)
MNEIVRIHIASVPYEIDVDAKKELDKYVKAIENSLGEAADVMDDIEIRITEILAERGVEANAVIRASDVAAIKDQLGEPTDFSSDRKQKSAKSTKIADQIREGFANKKYFRDPENGILGGVVSGFANYSGWDVTLLRVLLVLFCIFTAFMPISILYIVIWICAPEAKTAADHLSMKGEPVNLESIKTAAKNLESKTKTAAHAAKSNLKPIARGVLMFFGIIGLLAFIPTLIAFIPLTIVTAFHLFAAAIASKPLFTTTVILSLSAVFIFIIAGLTTSFALITAKFTKTAKSGLLASLLVSFLLIFAAATTAAVWYHQVGRQKAAETVENLIDDTIIEVRDHNTHVQIGPLHFISD